MASASSPWCPGVPHLLKQAGSRCIAHVQSWRHGCLRQQLTDFSTPCTPLKAAAKAAFASGLQQRRGLSACQPPLGSSGGGLPHRTSRCCKPASTVRPLLSPPAGKILIKCQEVRCNQACTLNAIQSLPATQEDSQLNDLHNKSLARRNAAAEELNSARIGNSAPLASATLALTARVATLSVDYAEETMKQAGESEVGPVRGHQGCLCGAIKAACVYEAC